MTDFEKMIRDMVANGAKVEDIAKWTGDTLNTIQKEQATKKSNRSELYEALEGKFHQKYAEGYFDVGDVAILAALVVTPDYPEWTVNNINEFVDGVTEVIKMRAEMVGRTPIEGIMKALDMAGEIRKEKLGAMRVKTEDKPKRTMVNQNEAGKKCTCKKNESDTDKVNKFLKDLGLDIQF